MKYRGTAKNPLIPGEKYNVSTSASNLLESPQEEFVAIVKDEFGTILTMLNYNSGEDFFADWECTSSEDWNAIYHGKW